MLNSYRKKLFALQLSIIIVNYNVKYFLEQCLLSVIKACQHIEAEILVVDNHSTDGSFEFFANRFPQVQFIWKKKNEGFSKANNEALRLAMGEAVLFLNPDTIVPEDCLEKCLDFFAAQKNAGALGVYMIDGSGHYLPESKRGRPTLWASFCKITGLTKLFPQSKVFARYYLGHLSPRQTHQIDVLSGAFMMVKKKVLDSTGGFDEQFFMYGEDIDLSYRIQKAGYYNYYLADTAIIHFKGESTVKRSVEYVGHFYGAMILFIQKHYSGIAARNYTLFVHCMIVLKRFMAFFSIISKKANTTATSYCKAIVPCKGKLPDSITERLSPYFPMVETVAPGVNVTAGNVALVFCDGCLSFGEIIGLMKEWHGCVDFFIHAEGSNAIVGSSDKTKTGIVLPLQLKA
jgi:N-acetylglucosaminyl-diphospho-decaprenol L-rhamnosyltransferase